MSNNNFSYAGFWRRYSANVLDYVIISFIFLTLIGSFASMMHTNLMNSYENNASAIQEVLYNYEHFLRIFGFGIPWYRIADAIEYADILYFLLYRLSFILSLPFLLMFSWCYYAGLESSPIQATFGKYAVGLYVTDNKGDRISFGRATARHFSKIISNIVLLLGYLLAGWTSKKQALHDLISDCLVLKR